MADPTNTHLRVRCGCGAKLKVSRTAVGRRIKCPKCGSAMEVNEHALVANAPLPPPTSSVSPPPDEEGQGLLEDLLTLESTAAAMEAPVSSASGACPRCDAPLAEGVRVCVACGTDVTTGRALAAATVHSPEGVAPRRRTRLVGRFATGCVLSGAGALVGAALWYVVAYYAGLEIGWIAWGVGVLAGLGMRRGYGAQDVRASLVAVGMTLAAILFAKLALYQSGVNLLNQVADPERQRIAYLQDEQCNTGYYATGAPPWLIEENPERDCAGERDGLFEMDDAAFVARKVELESWREARWQADWYARLWLAYNQAWREYDEEVYGGQDERVAEEAWDEAAEAARWQKHLAASYEIVDGLDAATILARARSMAEAEEAGIVEDVEQILELAGVGKSFFGTMFSAIDALFIFLALGSAMKLAGGEGS